ncbi:MAG: 50S ribosomal protein L13 [Candidatus Nanoarchaeia archaeon]|nr:50S ribosomal protein L13 [Candidatus Nanoarchaeia archaeon]
MIIDGTNMILGRLATFAARKSLEGEDVIIVNAEKVVISGKKNEIIARYNEKTDRGNRLKGPYFPKQADRLVRRTIRGMLPYKQGRGKIAFRKVMCYLGIPEKYKNEKMETVKQADFNRLKTAKFMRVDRLTQLIGK